MMMMRIELSSITTGMRERDTDERDRDESREREKIEHWLKIKHERGGGFDTP